jgi:hypothetical protein
VLLTYLCDLGGLVVISHHNEIQDELSDLFSKVFFPSAVCDEPIIHTSCAAEPKLIPEKQESPAKRLFWNNSMEDLFW